jgi:hypothetical protein
MAPGTDPFLESAIGSPLHFEGSDERTAAVYEFVEPDGFEIFGNPSDQVLEATRQAVAGSGVSLSVQPGHLGGFLG